MNANIQFDLDDPQDRHRFQQVAHLDHIYSTLWELQELLRSHLKYDKPLTMDEMYHLVCRLNSEIDNV